TPITWDEFYNWIHANIIDPDKASQDYELKYQALRQSEGQTVHDFVSTLQSIEGHLEKYSDYQQKMHLFDKILPSLHAEFERYAVKLCDLFYDAFITKLSIVESNILKTITSVDTTTQRKSATHRKGPHDDTSTAPKKESWKCKKCSDIWCDVH
ncbi:hypothetical protein ACO22_05890, partial [Paracoccidioides brasiliensis]